MKTKRPRSLSQSVFRTCSVCRWLTLNHCVVKSLRLPMMVFVHLIMKSRRDSVSEMTWLGGLGVGWMDAGRWGCGGVVLLSVGGARPSSVIVS